MNDANVQIKALLQKCTDVTLKMIIQEYQQLQNTGLLRADTSLYKELTKKICNLYQIPYNLRMGESWLVQEVFSRFVKSVPNKRIEKQEKETIDKAIIELQGALKVLTDMKYLKEE